MKPKNLAKFFLRFCFLLVLLGSTPALVEAAGQWKAGVASRSITPQQLMWMAGYGSRNHPAESKLTELWAKALVLESPDGKRAALVTLDLVGIDRTLSQRICGTLQKKHQMERSEISLCTSHTHSGPVVGRNLGPLHYLQVDQQQQQRIDKYADWLHDQVEQTVSEAIADLAVFVLAGLVLGVKMQRQARERSIGTCEGTHG